jgi:hypothetical protein
MTSPTWQWRPPLVPPLPARPAPPKTPQYFTYARADLHVENRAERRVVLGPHDVGSFEFTFDGADLWARAETPELHRAVTEAARRALPREVDFLVLAAPGSLRLTVVAWLRAGWDRLTGRRREDASGTATVDTKTLGQRLRDALAEVVQHPVEAVHRGAKVVQAAQLLKAALDWIRDRLPDAITVFAGF